MTFTLFIKTEENNAKIKEECIQALIKVLGKRNKKFEIYNNPYEIDMDSVGKA